LKDPLHFEKASRAGFSGCDRDRYPGFPFPARIDAQRPQGISSRRRRRLDAVPGDCIRNKGSWWKTGAPPGTVRDKEDTGSGIISGSSPREGHSRKGVSGVCNPEPGNLPRPDAARRRDLLGPLGAGRRL